MIINRKVKVEEVDGTCDRCKRNFLGLVSHLTDMQGNPRTTVVGFYYVQEGAYADYGRPGEEHVCNACMKSDKAYQEDFGE